MRNYAVVDHSGPTTPPTQNKRRRVLRTVRDPTEEQIVAATTPRSEDATPSGAEITAKTTEWLPVVPFVSTPATEGSPPGLAPLSWPALPTIQPYEALSPTSTVIQQDLFLPQYSDDALLAPSMDRLGSPNAALIGNNVGGAATHEYVRKLSQINLDLASQVDRMVRPGPVPMTIKTLIVPDCGRTNHSGAITSPVEDMIAATIQYLDILGLVAGIPKCSSFTALNRTASNIASQRESTAIGTSGGLSQTPASVTASRNSENASDFSVQSATTLSSGIRGSQPRVDSSTLLLLLICYIHILKLHVAMFAHVRSYLELVAESEDPTLGTLPSLYGFDNFPLRELLLSCDPSPNAPNIRI